MATVCFGRRRESRPISITHPSSPRTVSSYKDLVSPTEKIPRERKKRVREWKAGLYPIEIVEDTGDGYVKIHYTGWSTKYDQLIKETELVEVDDNLEGSQSILNLGSLIKDNLTAGTRLDSVVWLRAPMGDEDFTCLEENLNVIKHTKTKTVYGLNSRFSLCHIFGKNWDYRILNKEGDCVYIKTATVKIYHRKQRECKDFVVQVTDGQLRIEESLRVRAKQVVFTFVKCTGNYRLLPNLLNDSLL